MNNDTVLVTDLQPAAELLRRGEGIGIVGADMLGRDLRSLPCAGRFPSPLRLMKFSSMLTQPAKLAANSLPAIAVDWMQGSFLFTTVENWQALSGLDDGYFMYGEDIDFCRRTAERGLCTVFCPAVRYVHFGGFDASRLYLLHAGFRRYFCKFSGWSTRMLAAIVLDLGLVARIVAFGLLYLWKRDRASTDLLRYLIRAYAQH
jgi:GT2 family glycosyltransferase